MHRTAFFAFVALATTLFAVALPAQSTNDEASPLTHGIVKSVDAKAATVTLDHEDIPGVMMAMTMTFGVADPAVLDGLAVGQAVDFRVRKDGDDYVVTEIVPAKMAAEESHENAMSCCNSCMGAHHGHGGMHQGMGGAGHDGMRMR